jgi:hypothetical protein
MFIDFVVYMCSILTVGLIIGLDRLNEQRHKELMAKLDALLEKRANEN